MPAINQISIRDQIKIYNNTIKSFPDHNVKYKRSILLNILAKSEKRNRKHWMVFDENILYGRFSLFYKEWKICYKKLHNWKPVECDDKFRIQVYKSEELVKHIVTVDEPPTPDYFLTIQSFIELGG